MTIAQMTAEILARAGEGYQNYTARAKAMIRAAMSVAIQSKAIDLDEIDGSIKAVTRVTATIPNEDAPIISVIPAVLATDIVIYSAIEVDKHTGVCVFTPVDTISQLNNIYFMNALHRGSAMTNLVEVLYAINLPRVHIGWTASKPVNATMAYTLTQVVTTESALSTDGTNLNGMFNEKCQQVIIDTAARMLIDEINR